MKYSFDVVIVGAGPSGSAAAIKLADNGLKVALLDKATFPRDKTCGDALSVDVINQLKILSPALLTAFENLENKVASYGVKIFSPDHHSIDIPFIYKGKKSHGYICPRLEFDNLLVNFAKHSTGIQLFENCLVTGIKTEEGQAIIETTVGTFETKIVLGADGAHSVVSKLLGENKIDKQHYCGGLRNYYENVSSFHNENFIELHFFKDILPGYVWIFPLADNKANVGIGVLSSIISRKKINLKVTLDHLLKTHPDLKDRFKDARPLESVKGYGLPLGSKKRKLSGDHFLLLGDAAGLIDPFSGEGVANAIRSGRVAADHVMQCFKEHNFSASFNRAYDQEIYRRMWKEFLISRRLMHAIQYPRLFNFVIKKAGQSKYLQKILTDALSEIEKKKKVLYNPAFYYRIFIK